MAVFGKESEAHLPNIHPVLRLTLIEAIHYVDFKIICSFRNEIEQNKAFAEGKSQKQWPNGNHNQFPSLAVDIAPYPIDWSDKPKSLARFYYVVGVIKGVFEGRKSQGIVPSNISMRWGGDWNGNGIFTDQSFDDVGHIELIIK